MTHYVCPGCGNMAETPEACNTQGCNMMGQMMLACDCTDGMHGDISNPQV